MFNWEGLNITKCVLEEWLELHNYLNESSDGILHYGF